MGSTFLFHEDVWQPQVLATVMTNSVGAVMSVANVTQQSASDVGHATLYGACTGLIIAVLVVLYFGEKIIPPEQHGPWAIYLGAIIGAILLTPLLALAGFIPDTARTRVAVVGGTLLFIFAATRVVVRNWGQEDGRKLAAARQRRPLPAWDASSVLPAPESSASALTERERAAQVFAAVAHLARQFSPDVVLSQVSSGQAGQEAERQAQLAGQWMQVEARLLAVSAGYPSVAVRRQVPVFQMAALTVMNAASELLTAARANQGSEECTLRTDEAWTSLLSLASAWGALVAALHADSKDEMSGQAEQEDWSRRRSAPRSRRAASLRRSSRPTTAGLMQKRQRRDKRLR
jgi:hypothetical protein